MHIIRSIDTIEYNPSTVLTVGVFDGVHSAHQLILKKVKTTAKECNARNLLITFEPHPQVVLNKSTSIKLLNTIDERLYLFEKYGIENVLVINFNKEFAALSFNQFYRDIVVKKIGVSTVVEGFNHHFGNNRAGTIDSLKKLGNELGFTVIPVESVAYENEPISSSRIRTALDNGELDKANAMLGYSYSLSGTVIEGDKRGRTLGYPTANLQIPSSKLIPRKGIYFSTVLYKDKMFYGLTSVGNRPTFYQNGSLLVEVHILDFNEDIYGQSLTVRFEKRLRDEMRFNTVDELVAQMDKDKEISKSLIHMYRVA